MLPPLSALSSMLGLEVVNELPEFLGSDVFIALPSEKPEQVLHIEPPVLKSLRGLLCDLSIQMPLFGIGCKVRYPESIAR